MEGFKAGGAGYVGAGNVPARSRLGREHDRVRAIEDRVGYVARLTSFVRVSHA